MAFRRLLRDIRWSLVLLVTLLLVGPAWAHPAPGGIPLAPRKTADSGAAPSPLFFAYDIPSDVGFLHRLAAGPDGTVWFGHLEGLGHIIPTGTVTVFDCCSSPFGMSAGADGNMWYSYMFRGAGGIASVTPIGQRGASWEDGLIRPTELAPGPDGNIWFDDGCCNIGRITPDMEVSFFALPADGSPGWSTVGPDDNLWFSHHQRFVDDQGYVVYRWTINRLMLPGTITQYVLPVNRMWGLTTGPDGALWFGTEGIGSFRLDGQVEEFPLPMGMEPPGPPVVGPDGNLWFTNSSDELGRITATGEVTRFEIPPALESAAGLILGPDGNLWFCDCRAHKVVKVILDPVDLFLPYTGA